MTPANEFWAIKEDGSLRNGGAEYVTPPLKDQEIACAVPLLFDQMLPKTADFSARTSIHVHLNVRDWSMGDILKLMLVYAPFEKLLYKYAGAERYKNNFCVPIQETKLPIVLSNYLANGDFGGLLGGWAKYSGLNLLPIKVFGTVEYRHMRGHRDTDHLLTWINILQRMHIYARNEDFKTLLGGIQSLNTTSYYEQFLRDVFKKDADKLMTKNLQKDMEYGVSLVKAIKPPSPFLINLLGNISNKSPLLKGLGISEAETKKAKKPNDFDAYQIFVQGFRPQYAGLDQDRLVRAAQPQEQVIDIVPNDDFDWNNPR
jgi:hypothetical protein